MYTSKEKHSLTRKLVGYRNWRQRWCKKKGNNVLHGKRKILYLAHVNITEPKEMLNIGFLSHFSLGGKHYKSLVSLKVLEYHA